MTQSRRMRLGLFFEGEGHHVAAWRHPDVDARGRLSIGSYIEIARLAERGKFDLLFTADTNATFGADDVDAWKHISSALRLEPLTLLGALSVVTERIGLVATMTTTYYEPFHVARFFATLDRISKGRAGWNLVTSLAAAEAFNFGRDTHVAHSERYVRAREFAQVVLGLWDSWEDDAILADKQSGLYFNAEKLHFLNYKGPHFSVRGPLMVPPSEQGHPVIVQAGQSGDGRELAAETAEIVFTVQQELEAGRSFYSDVKRRAEKYGREPDSIKIMPGVVTVIGQTQSEAEDKYSDLQNLIDPEFGVRQLSAHWGTDLSGYPMDGPVPDPPDNTAELGRVRVMLDLARRENLTIRQLYQRVIGQRAHRTVIGTPSRIADALEEWFIGGACDGFNLLPLTFPKGLEELVNLLVPELQRRRLFRTEYEGSTLRENLGLPFPKSRWDRRKG